MATRKMTITLDAALVDALTQAARKDDIPVSRLVARAAEHELRLRIGSQAVQEWESEHGPLSPQQMATARAELADADAAHLASLKHSAA